MLIDDLGGFKKEARLRRQSSPVPETGWRPPQCFPDLSDAVLIGFDLERRERDAKHGPGWARGKAETVGFSVSAQARNGSVGAWYFPVGHSVEPEFNIDRMQAFSWLRHTLQNDIPKVGANLLYDVGSLTDDQIYVGGRLHDVQFAEAILDDEALVNLDALGNRYLGEGKTTNLLYQWCAEQYGGNASPLQRANIWRASPRLVGPYGERDALMPLYIIQQQWQRLAQDGLAHIYDLECRLISLLVRMRLAGVRVDLDYAHRLHHELGIDVARLYAELRSATGVAIDSVSSGAQVAKVFDKVGVKYPRTLEGNPSFRKDWLKNIDHPIAALINDIREHEKLRGTFIRNYILEGHVNGRIHCQFHPLRNDEGGTKTGRFASSDPNLQNIPARTLLGKRIRRCFVPDHGHVGWGKADYNQIEYRYLAKYAVGPGAEELRLTYQRDPKTDYHAKTIANVLALTGREIDRRPIKNLNFGLIYGASESKITRMNGFTPEQGRSVFQSYHQGNPYVRPTMQAISDEVEQMGYITTVLGRRTYFRLWEPRRRDYDAPRPYPLPYEAAIREYGYAIQRAGKHKAINYRLQGSAADQIKVGMRNCYEAGVFEVTGMPRLQVHDELDFSIVDDSPMQLEAYREMRHLLETSISMPVPIIVDFTRAANWGDAK